ncbi:hypothetical protein C0J52_26645 [Blattella germanica]|nr:hypothetical protein C0J52_26645 [Blattella germanica]
MSYTNRRGKGKLVEAVKLRKKGRPTNFLGSFSNPLRAKYNGPRPIEASKLADEPVTIFLQGTKSLMVLNHTVPIIVNSEGYETETMAAMSEAKIETVIMQLPSV